MKLLNFLYQLKTEQVPPHVYIKAPIGGLYLGNNGKMEAKKVVYEIKKETRNGLSSQTLYNIENRHPLKFEYMKSSNDKKHEYVPEDKNNVTFNYVDIGKYKAKIMIGEENCLIRKQDNFVYAHKCSHSPGNEDEIFVIKKERPKVEKEGKRSYHRSSDEYSHDSEVSEKKYIKKKVLPKNADKYVENSDTLSNEVSVDASEEYTKSTESSIKEKPIIRTKIKDPDKLPVKKKLYSNNFLESSSPINQDITSSKAYYNDNTSSEFSKVIKNLQDTIFDLIEKLNKQNNGSDEKNFNQENHLQKNVHRRNAFDSDTSLSDLNESTDQMNSDNDYSKNYKDSSNYHISDEKSKPVQNTHSYTPNPDYFGNKNYENDFQRSFEEIYRNKLDKMNAFGNKISDLIRHIHSGNIDKIYTELKSLLERIKNNRSEYIQNAQNKANEYLMSLSNLTTKIVNLQKYLENIKANPHNYFATASPPNQAQPPGPNFVI